MRNRHKDLALTGSGIGSLSERTGVNIETIRYYERIGIMPNPPRTAGGQRIYNHEHFKRLAFIRRSRELGFSLDQVRALLRLADGGDHSCREVHDMTLVHIADIRRKVADLKRMERVLKDLAARCDSGDIPDCPILDALSA